MKFIKNNVKIIIAFILGIVLSGGIVYAAAVSANQVDYTTDKNAEIKNVGDALNDLYIKYNNVENYNNKTYVNTGLTTYSNRAALTGGGYYVDKNGVTWVNVSFKFNSVFNQGTWLLIYGLPNLTGKSFIVSDTTKKMPFWIQEGNSSMPGKIIYIGSEKGVYNNPTNTVITLQFKY